MKERDRRRSLAGRPLRSWISTFHSFCVRLLRREAAAAGLPRDFVIYDERRPARRGARGPEARSTSARSSIPRGASCRGSPAGRTPARGARGRGRDAWPRAIRPASPSATSEILRPAHALDFDDLLLRTRGAPRRTTRRCASATGGASATCWWTSTRTPTAPSTSSSATWRADRATSPWWATRTSPSTRGAAPTSRTSSTSRHDFPGARVLRLEENYRSTPGHPRRRVGPRRPQREAQGQDPARGRGRREAGAPAPGRPDEFQEAAWVVAASLGRREQRRAPCSSA